MTGVAHLRRHAELAVFAATVVAVMLVGLLTVRRLTPSARANAAADDFSAARAENVLRRLELTQPHPIGADMDVRGRLIEQLHGLGYAVETPAGYACSDDAMCGRVTNVLARLDGTEAAPAIALTAHYDSVRGGPGVADDGAGVAVVLEVARLMKATGPQRRPVIFLLTDGEEAGMLGARAFAASAAVSALGAVVNLEARGGTGPSLMFETSAGNGWLTTPLSRLPHPVTSSLFATVYAQLPNDTDFTVFKNLGIAGVNFAFIGDGCRYHSGHDDMARLSLGSLQDQGDHALAMVRAFESAETWPPPKDVHDAVFFDVASAFVLSWPVSLAPGLALIALASVGLAGAALVRRRRASLRAIAAAFGAVILCLPVVGFAGAGVSALLERADLIVAPWPPTVWGVALVVLSISVAVSWTAALALRRCGGAATWVGVWTVWVVATMLVSLRVPTASYLFVPPAFAAGITGSTWGLLRDERAPMRMVALAFPPVVVALLWSPFTAVLYQALGAHALPSLALAAAPISCATIPALAAVPMRRLMWLPLSVVGVTAVGVAVMTASPRFSPAEPDHVPIEYVEDADEHRAAWVLTMADLVPNSFGARRFQNKRPFPWTFPWEHFGPFASTEPLGLAPPELTITSSERNPSGGRTVRGVLRSIRGAPTVALLLHAESVVRATVEDTLVPDRRRPTSGWWKIESRTTSPTGVHLALTLQGPEPADAEIVDETTGLPQAGDDLVRLLPDWAVSAQDGELTVVARRQTL